MAKKKVAKKAASAAKPLSKKKPPAHKQQGTPKKPAKKGAKNNAVAGVDPWPILCKFYTNLLVSGVEREALVAWLKKKRRRAWLSPTMARVTVLFDKGCEEAHEVDQRRFGMELSKELKATVMIAGVHDDDFLVFDLIVKGKKVDSYHSCPEYFEDDPQGGISLSSATSMAELIEKLKSAPRTPARTEGGDVAQLKDVFGAEASVEEIDAILRSGDYPFASERHRDLAKVLGLPIWSAGTGYKGVNTLSPMPAGFEHLKG